jgi:iron complex transport system substrate-binding protein
VTRNPAPQKPKAASKAAPKAASKVLLGITLLSIALLSALGGCVDQYGGKTLAPAASATPAATTSTSANGQTLRIIATSPAVVEIADLLDLDLIGVPNNDGSQTPARYQDATAIGAAMTPDMERLKSLGPDYILSPASLSSDLQPKYETLDVGYYFLNLRSVPGMFKSISELGEKFGRQNQAQALVADFVEFYDTYRSSHNTAAAPRVLILMGLPGSYIVATENSYVGSLVQLAGGQNVYAGSTEEFLNANTEDMEKRDPDIILRAAHALPDDVIAMFKQEFEQNDIWKHFRATAQARVYDLDYEKFGMSAKFNYKEALGDLETIFYGEAAQ